MNIFINFQDPIKAALQQIFPVLYAPHLLCDSPEEADFIIVEDKVKLHELFNQDKFFAIFSLREVTNLPPNACWLPMLDYPVPMGEYLQKVQAVLDSRKQEISRNCPAVKCGIEYSPTEINDKTRKVLVIDDNPENRNLAMELLGKNHFVTLSSGFGEGLRLVRANHYDVVLSDCQMPPETKHSPLSIDAIVIGQTVHNGIFLIFHATKCGARVAIVTDANHHNDWVSALFDDGDLHQPQEVNGQPVLLINYMGKRWDRALEAITAL